MSAATLDDHTLSTLEPEERDAIAGNDGPADAAALKAVIESPAGTAEGNDDDADDETGEESAPAAAAKTESTQAAATPAPAPAAQADEPPAASAAQPSYRAELPGDFQERVAALKAAKDDLAARFKAGEIDIDEFQAENDKLVDQRDELSRMQVKAELSQEMTAQQAERQWADAIAGLFTKAARADGGGVDYAKDDALRGDLDAFVKLLAANDANADKPMQWFLDEAHRRVLALHGKAATGSAPAASAPAQAAAAPAARTAPPVAAAPKTLAHVPGGDGPGDIAGEFADIDSLEGDALEDAIRRMSPVQRERYQRGL